MMTLILATIINNNCVVVWPRVQGKTMTKLIFHLTAKMITDQWIAESGWTLGI